MIASDCKPAQPTYHKPAFMNILDMISTNHKSKQKGINYYTETLYRRTSPAGTDLWLTED